MTERNSIEVHAELPDTSSQPVEGDQPSHPDAPPVEGDQETPLLAGKYKTAADLEAAYKALESKLGAANKPEATPQNPSPQPAPVEAAPSLFTQDEMDAYRQELAAGALTEESRQAIQAKGLPAEWAEAFFAGQQALGQRELDAWIEAEGGADEMDSARQWALENWSPESQQAWQERYEQAKNIGDYRAMKQQWQMVMAQYKADRDTYPSTDVRGTRPEPVQPFSSQEEITAVMSDPRYARNEKAYVEWVRKRLAVSNV